MDIMESLVKQLPNGFGLEWTAMSYQERLSGAQAPALYAISLLVVFLCLAALYESWSVPFSVMLVVPLGVIGALLATLDARAGKRRLLRGGPVNGHWFIGEKRHPDRRVC